MAYGAILVYGKLNANIRQGYLIFWILIMTAAIQFGFHYPLNKLAKSGFWQEDSWVKNNRMLLAGISPDAGLAAQQNFVPHLSERKNIYLTWPRKKVSEKSICGENLCWWLDFAGKPEYLVVDERPDQWITQILEYNENFNQGIRNMENSGNIQLIKSVSDAKLYRIIYP
jgi:hypothetical protein